MSGAPYPRLWAWFDDGLAVQALRGEGEFFIPGVTWRDRHDELLVLRHLVLWADDRESWPSALASVEGAMQQATDAGDFKTVVGLAWAALLVGDDMHEALLTDKAVQLAIHAARLPGHLAETQAVAEAVIHLLESDTE